MRVAFAARYVIFKEVLCINAEMLINYEIKEKEVRVIGNDGEQLGIMPLKQAISMAEERELDLCLIAPKATPPVCKIMDFGKYKFEMAKREKEAKKKQKVIVVKEIQLSPTIEEHDMRVKCKKAFEFLADGDRIKVSIRFRGRQIAHPEVGKEVMNAFINMLEGKANIDKPPILEGRHMLMFLSPKDNK